MKRKGEAQDVHAPCRKLVSELTVRIEKLEEENRELRARLNQNSQNSSRPPSTDKPEDRKKRRRKKPSGKKPGGQPGHPGHERKPLDRDDVDHIVAVHPERCEECGKQLAETGDVVDSHQVCDIPPVKPETTQYDLYGQKCRCGHWNEASLPAGVPVGNFGPRLMALVGYLVGRLRLSKRLIQDTLGELFGVTMSLGSVSNTEKKLSRILHSPYDEAREYVQKQFVRHADETGWREGKKKAWLWVAATSLVTVFLISRFRGSEVARMLLGEIQGYLVSDRWSAYRIWAVRFRQLCWSHLIRDFEGFGEREGKSARIGKKLLKEAEGMFALWYRVRDGTLARSTFQKKMKPIRRRVERLLRRATRCGNRTTEGKSRNILEFAPALWTFVRVEGIEPTNNFGERQVRHAVLYRKTCFGTHSLEGSRFVERMLTTVMTLRQQGRNILEYLTEAVKNDLGGRPAPSLLPS